MKTRQAFLIDGERREVEVEFTDEALMELVALGIDPMKEARDAVVGYATTGLGVSCEPLEETPEHEIEH